MNPSGSVVIDEPIFLHVNLTHLMLHEIFLVFINHMHKEERNTVWCKCFTGEILMNPSFIVKIFPVSILNKRI